MAVLLPVLSATVSSKLRSRTALEGEHMALWRQIAVLQRSAGERPKLTLDGRLFLGLLFPGCNWLSAAHRQAGTATAGGMPDSDSRPDDPDLRLTFGLSPGYNPMAGASNRSAR